MTQFPSILTIILLVFVVVMLFNIIIFVHELGHFLAGRWRGLKIDRFQIWFGKPIWKKEINGVQYGLGWIPAGGFVALPQMAPMEGVEGKNLGGDELPAITPLDKIIVAVAGPVFSLLLALAAAGVVWVVGKPKDFVPSTTIGYVEAGMPGDKAGIKAGDQVLTINGEKVNGFAGTLESITERVVLSSGEKIVFTVKRPGVDEPVTLTSGFDTQPSRWWQRRNLRQVGLAPAGVAMIGDVYKNSPAGKAGLAKGDAIVGMDGVPLYSSYQLAQSMEANGFKTVSLDVKKRDGAAVKLELTPAVPQQPAGSKPKLGVLWDPTGDVDVRIVHPKPFEQIYDSLHMMWVTVTKVADPRSSIGVDHLSGPIGIAKMLYTLLLTEDGWRRIIGFMVLFNVNLAVLNMLPFPVLDGGHITMGILEKIAGRPVKARALEMVQTVCALALITLMLFVTSKDLLDPLGRGGSKDGGEVIFAE